MTFARLRVAAGSVAAIVIVAGLASAQTSAQAFAPGRETSAASVASYTLAQEMPVDPEAATGTLPNGLRYYVRANGKPEHI
ncbi:MAG TPA: hypothetical protein VG871_04400, partial [Vicinamibacterales bacterium]|nr:hypothetical protein [Vicinamibacterales bacterium]